MHWSGSTCGVNRWRRCIRKRKSRERLCCGYTGSRLINNELFFFVEDHGSRVGNLGDLCRSSREVGNVLLHHRAVNGLHEVALRFTSLWWLLSAAALSAACSLSIVAVVVVVGTVSCIFTAFAPCVPGTRVNGAQSIICNADTGGSTGGVFTPSLGSLSLSLSLGRQAPIFALMAATTAKPLSLLLVINRIVSSSSSPGRSALSCVIRILKPFR